MIFGPRSVVSVVFEPGDDVLVIFEKLYLGLLHIPGENVESRLDEIEELWAEFRTLYRLILSNS